MIAVVSEAELSLSRVELFERIRRDRRVDPRVSVRMLASRYDVHRGTVREALVGAQPREWKRRPARWSVLEPAHGWIDEMSRADLTAPRKQRHTIIRIYQRLITEYDFRLASHTTVRTYVNKRRRELDAEAREGHGHLEGMVPQRHLPGAEAEVDFAEVWVRIAGRVMKCHLFTLRLSFSGKAVHRVFISQAQEAFMEGHVEVFETLGGIPTKHIRYDNLKPAVHRICFGRDRIESQRWVAFRSHYGFDAFYRIPGAEGAHEQGGVEREGGRFRRTHLVPVPEVASRQELNEKIAQIDRAEDDRILHGQQVSIGCDFQQEAELLAPVPFEAFDCGVTLTPKVGRDSRVTVRQRHYSVPARLIGTRVRVSLRANEVLVLDRGTVIARHARGTRSGESHDNLDHYLEIPLGKPGALAGSTALATARSEGSFTPAHEALCLIGDSGTGKSHLLIGIGTATAESGLRVRYTTTANLVNELAEAADDRQLTKVLNRYSRVDLLCLDEFGYLELDKAGAKLLFQIFTDREERRAIAVASNAPFSEWQRTFNDQRLCTAIVDRLTFNGHILETGTDSYRLRSTQTRLHG